jgi:formate dehydrogenase major subunit
LIYYTPIGYNHPRLILLIVFYHLPGLMSVQNAERSVKAVELTRRDFLKVSGAGFGALFIHGASAQDTDFASPRRIPLRKRGREKTTIRPYCGVGCGAIVAVDDRKIINIGGNPDHPINEGSLCSKEVTHSQLPNSISR